MQGKQSWKVVGVVNFVMYWRGSRFYGFNEKIFTRGSVMGILQILGPNYPEISISQLNPFRTLSLNI